MFVANLLNSFKTATQHAYNAQEEDQDKATVSAWLNRNLRTHTDIHVHTDTHSHTHTHRAITRKGNFTFR